MNWKPSKEVLELLEEMINFPDDYNLTENGVRVVEELYEALKKL